MQDLMASCQEISWADVELCRSGGHGGPATHGSVVSAVADVNSSNTTAAENAGDHAAIIDLDPPPSEPSELVLKALTWATKLQDEALVINGLSEVSACCCAKRAASVVQRKSR